MRIAVVGGTGKEGFGLTVRLARAGHEVTIGSRVADRGAEAAGRATEAAGTTVAGTDNAGSIGGADAVIVTVPFAAQADIYRSIKEAVPARLPILDATSPLATAVGGKAWQTVRPWHGSAAEQAHAILGAGANLVAGFHTIEARALQDLEHPIDSDVLLCGNDLAAKALFGGLIDEIPGLRWVDCGDLSMARIVETLTALLISVNRTYEVKDAGFRLTGHEGWGSPG
jgi:8-hydroxy-5-deazaflavin:NADPH oxidoreductase